MKRKTKLLLIFCFIFLVSGCFEEKLNKTEYNLSEIYDKANYKKDNQSYIMEDVGGNKYIFYFDDKDYNNNYYMNIRVRRNNEEAKFYYHKNIFSHNNCEINVEQINGKNNCTEEELNKMKSLTYSFNNMTSSLRITKEDLKILAKEVDNKKINIEELS